MSKYIIKNCPCYTSKGGYYDCWANQDTWCENITNCVIKQVIDRCKSAISNYSNLEILRTACETSEAYGRASMAQNILDEFEIYEVEQ